MSKLTLELEGDRYVVVRRRFDAPPESVYRAHVEPELVQQWMLGPDVLTADEPREESITADPDVAERRNSGAS